MVNGCLDSSYPSCVASEVVAVGNDEVVLGVVASLVFFSSSGVADFDSSLAAICYYLTEVVFFC